MDRYIFHPAERAWVAYLKTALPAGTRVSAQVPNERPVKFVEVKRTGGSSGLVHDDAQMTFKCWGASLDEAAGFAAEVHRLVMSARVIAGRPVKNKRTIGSPVAVPDPPSGSPVYQFTVAAELRGKFPEAP